MRRQQGLQLFGGLAGLGAVGLVGNHGKLLALGGRQPLNLAQRPRKGLNRADHDLLIARQRLGQLGALAALVALDGRHHASSALESKDGVLQLAIDDVAVRHHQHGMENLLMFRRVQVGQEVRRPGDRVGLARASRVLHQVLAARPFGQYRRLQLAGHVELVVAREDDLVDLLLLVALCHQVAPQDLEPAVARPHLLPQVCSAVAHRIDWVAGRAVVALVKGQEARVGADQPRDHAHFAGAHGKMHQCAGGEAEQRLRRLALLLRQAVVAVLVDRIVDALGKVSLELHGRHRDTVQEQH